MYNSSSMSMFSKYLNINNVIVVQFGSAIGRRYLQKRYAVPSKLRKELILYKNMFRKAATIVNKLKAT